MAVYLKLNLLETKLNKYKEYWNSISILALVRCWETGLSLSHLKTPKCLQLLELYILLYLKKHFYFNYVGFFLVINGQDWEKQGQDFKSNMFHYILFTEYKVQTPYSHKDSLPGPQLFSQLHFTFWLPT